MIDPDIYSPLDISNHETDVCSSLNEFRWSLSTGAEGPG